MEGWRASLDAEVDSWLEREIASCRFDDVRHGKRLRTLLEQLWERIGGSIPFACQDWAATKAAYRFFSNGRISEDKILTGHFLCTKERFAAARGGPVLMLHDTSEFVYRSEENEAIGMVSKQRTRSKGRPRYHTMRGVLMHSSLAVTQQGLPLGLAAIKFWTRDKFHGANALKRKINPTRVPIEQKESYRWLENVRLSTALLAEPGRIVHIGDRESDIYELFSTAHDAGTHFLLRTCVDRLAGDGDHTVADEMREVRIQGLHRIEVRNRKGERSEAVVEIRYRRIKVLAPVAKQKLYPALELTVIHATEPTEPKDRERIEWKLIPDLTVRSREDAIEKLRWYGLRWKIETFHKILKSGCKAEEARLRAAERIVNLLAILCLLSWRIFWMTMLNRTMPEVAPELAFTAQEMYLLDQLVSDTAKTAATRNTLSLYLTKLARLGGYLARAKDPPPGNTVMWRGLTRLTDIQLGFILGAQLVGN
jgi:hypothetical protein